MRSKIMTSILFIALVATMNAQKFSITPQVGFENTRTSVNFNNLGFFAPLSGEFSPQISLRLDYKFKQGFGPYIGASTSRSVLLYNFSDIENGMNVFNASNGNMQVRLEAGYQFTTNPIFLKNSSAQKSPDSKSCGSFSYRSSCTKSSSSRSSHCQSKCSNSGKMASKNKGTWVKLQPSVGIGFIPSPMADVVSKSQGGQTSYEYRAGNWNTALQTGMGFEFGRNKQRLMNININYFSGIGNMNEWTITSSSGTKTSVAHLASKTSGWNLRVGIPFSLSEKKPTTRHHIQYRSNNRHGCCDRNKIQYRSHFRSL